jgi:hypothetical protein
MEVKEHAYVHDRIFCEYLAGARHMTRFCEHKAPEPTPEDRPPTVPNPEPEEEPVPDLDPVKRLLRQLF